MKSYLSHLKGCIKKSLFCLICFSVFTLLRICSNIDRKCIGQLLIIVCTFSNLHQLLVTDTSAVLMNNKTRFFNCEKRLRSWWLKFSLTTVRNGFFENAHFATLGQILVTVSLTQCWTLLIKLVLFHNKTDELIGERYNAKENCIILNKTRHASLRKTIIHLPRPGISDWNLQFPAFWIVHNIVVTTGVYSL